MSSFLVTINKSINYKIVANNWTLEKNNYKKSFSKSIKSKYQKIRAINYKLVANDWKVRGNNCENSLKTLHILRKLELI